MTCDGCVSESSPVTVHISVADPGLSIKGGGHPPHTLGHQLLMWIPLIKFVC